MGFDFFQALIQSEFIERFQEIVNGIALTGFNRKLVVGCNKDHGTRQVFLKPFQYAETRAVRLYSGGGSGVSFRVAKGVRFRLGSGGGKSYSEQELKTLDVGTFYITTKRYIFIGQKTNVIQPLKKVTSVEVLSDGIAISRTGKIN